MRPHSPSRPPPRAFTLRELAITVAAIAILITVAIPLLASSRNRQRVQQNQQQIRNIVQACVIWTNWRVAFPLPSAIDLANATIATPGRNKDTPANLVSLLIWQGMISPEVAVSPLETNHAIQPCLQYHSASPPAAAEPASALWDPAFSADFTPGHVGNLSYASLQLSGAYTISTARPVTDPTMHPGSFAGGRVVRPSSGRVSLLIDGLGWQSTLPLWSDRAHRGRSSSILPWNGSIGYADGHVTLESSANFPATLSYTSTFGTQAPDHPFLDEPDDPNQTNTFLGIFTTAGEKPSDFTAIWD